MHPIGQGWIFPRRISIVQLVIRSNFDPEQKFALALIIRCMRGNQKVVVFFSSMKQKGKREGNFRLNLFLLSLKRFLKAGGKRVRGPPVQRWITDGIYPVGLSSAFGNSQCPAPIDPSIQFAEITLGKEVQ